MKVLYIDNSEKSRFTHAQDLEDIFGDEVAIEAIPPAVSLEGMLEYIISQEDLVSIVVDERLDDKGAAEYRGMDLVIQLRQHFSKLPIYMLTNFIDDVVSEEFNVEYVFDKDHIFEDDYKKNASARARRHLNVFNDIIDEREIRFEELLREKISGEISPEEQDELEALQIKRIKPYASEFVGDKSVLENLERHEQELERINQELGGKE